MPFSDLTYLAAYSAFYRTKENDHEKEYSRRPAFFLACAFMHHVAHIVRHEQYIAA